MPTIPSECCKLPLYSEPESKTNMAKQTNRGDRPDEVTKTLRDLFDVNVIGNVHLFNLFIPLILKGQTKKVITISSGFADTEFTNKYDVTPAPFYSASKAAINMIVAKFSAQYKKDGVLFLALCPGMVDVGHYKDGRIHLSSSATTPHS